MPLSRSHSITFDPISSLTIIIKKTVFSSCKVPCKPRWSRKGAHPEYRRGCEHPPILHQGYKRMRQWSRTPRTRHLNAPNWSTHRPSTRMPKSTSENYRRSPVTITILHPPSTHPLRRHVRLDHDKCVHNKTSEIIELNGLDDRMEWNRKLRSHLGMLVW